MRNPDLIYGLKMNKFNVQTNNKKFFISKRNENLYLFEDKEIHVSIERISKNIQKLVYTNINQIAI